MSSTSTLPSIFQTNSHRQPVPPHGEGETISRAGWRGLSSSKIISSTSDRFFLGLVDMGSFKVRRRSCAIEGCRATRPRPRRRMAAGRTRHFCCLKERLSSQVPGSQQRSLAYGVLRRLHIRLVGRSRHTNARRRCGPPRRSRVVTCLERVEFKIEHIQRFRNNLSIRLG